MKASSISNQETIQRLIDVVVCDPAAVARLPTEELDLALRLGRKVRLLGRLGKKLESAGLLDSLPPIAADHLRGNMAMADARSRVALWEIDRIKQVLFRETSAPIVAMKGCAYILLGLPNAPGRIFADVDLMTSEAELENVEAILVAHGWTSQELSPYDQNYYRKWTHELPPLTHEEREVEIDLHHSIVPRTARLNPASDLLLRDARKLPDSDYQVLANVDIVLHAMTHLAFDSDFGDKFRDLVDIDDLIKHFVATDASFWYSFVERAKTLDLTRPAYYSIRYPRLYLNLDVPEFVNEALESWAPWKMAGWLMDRLVPRALYPEHPDCPSRLTAFCRQLLFVRSHWLRMPPWLLAYHLSNKFVRTRFTRNPTH